jgi:hypothetical protein
MNVCCPCDVLEHPGKPDIAAGLPTLPRQLAGFAEYRLAMLRDIPVHPALSRWRGREGNDLGLMLLEMWAYVLDILGFYDERIANEEYLRTAVLQPSLRKLVELIGYQPRPALASSVVLAAIADGKRLVMLPPRTGFRSGAFEGNPPQVFETDVEYTIHPLKNEWILGPVREKTVGDRLLLEAATARLSRDQIAVFVWPSPRALRVASVVGGQASFVAVAGKVEAARAVDAQDGQTYLEITCAPPPRFERTVRLADVKVFSPTLSAAVTSVRSVGPLVGPFSSIAQSSQLAATPSQPTQLGRDFTAGLLIGSVQAGRASVGLFRSTLIQLDAVYRQIQQDDLIVISRGAEFRAFKVAAASEKDVSVQQVTIPVTELEIPSALPSNWAARSLTVHFNMVDGGRPTRIARTRLSGTDFAPPGMPVEGLVEPIPESVARPSELLLLDALDNGAFANGTVEINSDGEGKVLIAAGTPPFTPGLRTPVTVFGNVVRATRGESVVSEVLGSGDASQEFPSFALGNKPLTYLNDPSARNGRRSTLEVRVNTIKWKEVSSFFGVGASDEVYIVRQNDQGESVVTFGDGVTGARLPTGVDNVRASYRFGAGAAKPPAGAISQLAKSVEGLRRAVNPVAAAGGADGDQTKDIRTNAPDSALILGRAVSVPDFEALAREFGGVVNAHVEWAWDESSQNAVVMVWFISDGGDIARELRGFLIGQADPNTPLVAVQADAQSSELVIDVEIDSRFSGETVVPQVRQALTNPDSILALENIPIGRPLFRSRVFDIVLSVEGTRSVRAMTVDGQAAPFAITVAQGRYRHFLDSLVVAGTR